MALDWQVGESEDENIAEPLGMAFETGAIPTQVTAKRWYRRRVWSSLVLATLLAMIAAGYYYWQGYTEGISRIRTDIQRTIDLEAWAWQSSNKVLADSLLDDKADKNWSRKLRWDQEWERRWAGDAARVPKTEIQNVDLRGDLALVAVVIAEPGVPWESTPYRETRFYRRTKDGWLRTSPVLDFWGSQHTFETDHFRFEFHERDAQAVKALAIEIEALYAGLRRDAGLDPAPAGKKLIIEVVPRTDVVAWHFAGGRLTVPSPALLRVPVGLSESARLAQSVAYPFAQYVLEEVLQQVQVKPKWYPLVEGLHLWLGWDDSVPPPGWRYYVEELLQKQLETAIPLHLANFTPSESRPWSWSERPVSTMAAETVVEYAMVTYGRDRLPALLQGFGKYETWETLIPAVFGVSVSEFEAGWQASLTVRYEPHASVEPRDEKIRE